MPREFNLPRTADVIHAELVGIAWPVRGVTKAVSAKAAIAGVGFAVLMENRRIAHPADTPTVVSLVFGGRRDDQRVRFTIGLVVVLVMPGQALGDIRRLLRCRDVRLRVRILGRGIALGQQREAQRPDDEQNAFHGEIKGGVNGLEGNRSCYLRGAVCCVGF